MSNCIRLTKNRVIFTADEIDISKVLDFVSSAKYPAVYPDINDKEGLRAMSAYWWFSERNVELHGSYIIVNFGEGHSSHTWRDFRWLLNEIAKMMKKAKYHTFYVRDEFDGFKEVGRLNINFQKGA